MKLRLSSKLTYDSIVDGPGLRMVVWTQGCNHNCKSCHNPQTHDVCGGFEVNTEDIIESIKNTRLQRGITLSGGEPFLQPQALIDIAREATKEGLDVWAYTGYKFEELLDKRNPRYINNLNLLKYIDVLVDGKFIESKKDINLRFRGSTNQRIINVKDSLNNKSIVLNSEYMNEENELSLAK